MSPRLLLVHAHPDDETLTTGGTMAAYAARGAEVTLVTCTLGEEGAIIPPELAGLAAGAADQLGGYRLAELRNACRALGIGAPRLLGGIGRWRDSGMAGTTTNGHPRAFVSGSVAEQVGELAGILSEIRPQVVITYDVRGGYGHPDHIRAHEITMAAVEREPSVTRVFHVVASRRDTEVEVAAMRLLEDFPDGESRPYRLPEPGELPTVPDDEITTRIAVRDHLPAKLAALRAHATQVLVRDERTFMLAHWVAEPVLDTECFVLARGDKAGAADDLFGGLTC